MSKMTPGEKERILKSGKIIVITGPSGSGKDSIIDELYQLKIEEHGLTRVVTHATRRPRIDKKTKAQEIDHVHYHFCTEEELTCMHTEGHLVEKPVWTGKTRKGTSKAELLKVLEGEHKLWRIDLTLAEKIAKGEYFKHQFDSETAELLTSATMVVYIDVDQETLNLRRAHREGDIASGDFTERDEQERRIVSESHQIFKFRLPNPENELRQTAESLFAEIIKFLQNDNLRYN